ncbi:MAG: SEC-C metal-binding domain-containing protein, partial [Acidiferrobacterales bacterium]|nr:SEC-C metal-binding domain-containing protein [Acidiferrobacterales bacterium]
TADTEAYEFQQIYGLEVVVIPTHKLMVRDDLSDLVYRTADEKRAAILDDIKHCHERSQPVLVGTTSIESSEQLSGLLQEATIPHQVLNAKHHEREAQIVAQAGGPGTVTIATNMAGRGTDIVLGGNLEKELEALDGDDEKRRQVRQDWQSRHDHVVSVGGPHMIGTERHESRRIDNQLRGRAGRQGDPGSSRFYLSLEDNLMRIFGSERVSGLMQKLGMSEGEAIEHRWVTRAIENAQRKVEARNFDIRKQLLEYDDVANEQRKFIYEQRNNLMEFDDISENIVTLRREVINEIIDQSIPPGSLEEQWNVPSLEEALEHEFGVQLPVAKWLDQEAGLDEEKLREKIISEFEKRYAEKTTAYGEEVMRYLEKAVMLEVLDRHWKEHLAAMDHLRQGIHLRGYAQKNPKEEYKREAFELFSAMLDAIKNEVIRLLTRIRIQTVEDVDALEAQNRRQQPMQYLHPSVQGQETAETESEVATVQRPVVRKHRKIGRNEPCPCGSGKKYKHCHGRLG